MLLQSVYKGIILLGKDQIFYISQRQDFFFNSSGILNLYNKSKVTSLSLICLYPFLSLHPSLSVSLLSREDCYKPT